MPNEQPSSNELLEQAEINTYFWDNLKKLNDKKNNHEVQIYLTLTSLQQQMEEVRHEKTKTAQAKRRAIREQAIQLFCPKFSVAPEHLKKQFLLQVCAATSVEKLAALIKTLCLATCDQMLSDLHRPFDQTRDYNFVVTMTQHKIIAHKKPSALYFDQRFAFSVFHSVNVTTMMLKINNFEKMACQSKLAFQNYHPLMARKSQAICAQAFSDALLNGFNQLATLMSLLAEESQRIRQQQPIFLLRPFYAKTMRAMQVWQYELLVQRLKMLAYAVDYLKKYREDLIAWLKELHQTGPTSFLLPKKFRDFFIQSVLDQNESVEKNYQHVLKQFHAQNKTHSLQQDLSFMNEVTQNLQGTKKELTKLLQTSLATVDVTPVPNKPPETEKAPEPSWHAAFLAGEKIPEVAFSTFMAREIKATIEPTADQLIWWKQVLQKLCEKIKGDAQALSNDYGYIKQAIELFLQLKKDSFLTGIKKIIAALPTMMQQHPVIKYCLAQIGDTVAERLVQIQNLIQQVDQAGVLVEDRLIEQVKAQPLLSKHVERLIDYAIDQNITTSSQLLAEQPVDTRLVVKIAGLSKIRGQAQKVLNNILSIAKYKNLLNEYLKTQQQLIALQKQDKFVPEVALPIAPVEQNYSKMMKECP